MKASQSMASLSLSLRGPTLFPGDKFGEVERFLSRATHVRLLDDFSAMLIHHSPF